MDQLAKYYTQSAPIDDKDEVARIKKGVRLQVALMKNQGVPIARYDLKKKQTYMEYPDGRRVYQSSSEKGVASGE